MLNCNIGVSAKNCFWKEPAIFAENVGMWHYCLKPSLQAPAQVCGKGLSPAPAQFGQGYLTPAKKNGGGRGGGKKKEKKGLGLNPAEIITSMKMRALGHSFDCC